MELKTVETRARAACAISKAASGEPLVFLHGAGGMTPDDPLLAALAERFHVYAPFLPGYGETEECADAARHARLHPAHLGRGRGAGPEEPDPGRPLHGRHDRRRDGGARAQRRLAPGADLARRACGSTTIRSPTSSPCCRSRCRSYLFHDAGGGRGADDRRACNIDDPKFLQDYLVRNARQLGMAGKLLFPIPERGLAERLYRIKAKTVIVWGESDRLSRRSTARPSRTASPARAGHHPRGRPHGHAGEAHRSRRRRGEGLLI